MMRPAPVCLLALTTTIWAGDAFVIPRSARHCAFAVSAASPAEEHLEELSESWNKLKEKEKEVERTQDDTAAYELAEEMLQTAIEITHTQELIEKEHQKSAQAALTNAVRYEDELQALEQEAHHEVEDAQSILHNYEAGNLPEDREKHREMAVADIAMRVEDYVETRLHQAKEAELRAREEADEAKRSLEELQRKEQDLKMILEVLQTLKAKHEAQQ